MRNSLNMTISQEQLILETWLFWFVFIMLWAQILQVQKRYFNKGQQSLPYPQNTQLCPSSHIRFDVITANIMNGLVLFYNILFIIIQVQLVLNCK